MWSPAADDDETNSESDSSPFSQLIIRIPRTASPITPTYPLLPVGTIEDHRERDLVQRAIHLFSQGRSNPSVQHLVDPIAIQNNARTAFPSTDYWNLHAVMPHRELQYPTSASLPINDVNLRAWMPHRELQYPTSAYLPSNNLRAWMLHQELQYPPWAHILPSFPAPFTNPYLLPPFPATQTIELQPDMQQLVQSIRNSNETRQYHDELLSLHIQANMQQESLANRQAILSRQIHESPIAAYLLSRGIISDSRENQDLAILDPPPPPLPLPGQILPQGLAQPEDQSSLSAFQVLLRQNIEVFQATSEEASIHLRGRNTPIYIHQVGIRCMHCKHVPMARRQKGSMYFPSNTLRIYQAAQNMATTHMISGLCAEMPDHVNEQFQMLMAARSTCGKGGRVYWAQSAETHLGLVNTAEGIRATAALL